MNTVIKLDSTHKDQFYEFIDITTSVRPELKKDILWKNIKYISDSREIFAILEDSQIIMVSAINYVDRMPTWAILDTVINIPMNLKKSYKTYSDLFDTINNHTQKKGISSYWMLRNQKFEEVVVGKKETDEYKGISNYGIMLSKIFKDYDIATRAYIKAGAFTNVPLYNSMLGGSPLNYDCVIRELSLKQATMVEKNLEKYFTYG